MVEVQVLDNVLLNFFRVDEQKTRWEQNLIRICM